MYYLKVIHALAKRKGLPALSEKPKKDFITATKIRLLNEGISYSKNLIGKTGTGSFRLSAQREKKKKLFTQLSHFQLLNSKGGCHWGG